MTMTSLHFETLRASLDAIARPMANHLWQSTFFALLAVGLTLGFRQNRAQIRFGLWLAASTKFLVPLSLLIGLGGILHPRGHAAATQAFAYTVIEQVSQPFSHAALTQGRMTMLVLWMPTILVVLWAAGTVAVLCLWWVRWLRISKLVSQAMPLGTGREFDVLRELERPEGSTKPLEVRVSNDWMEPAVFGILKPCLIWPEGISQHLSDAQLKAILAHELGHVRRRDNLVSGIHMLVEAAFWFHPLVWWIGAGLIEERERACDEQVLQLGNKADVYAESILKACKFCMESPLSCVSGVAGSNGKGSNLKRRIARIMNGQTSEKLSLGRRALLSAAAATVVAGPVVFGFLHAPNVRAQMTQGPGALSAASNAPAAAFDTILIKPSPEGDENSKVLIQIEDHTLNCTHVSVKDLIKFAYGVEPYQIQDAPGWSGSERYDIVATWKDAPGYAAQVKAMPGPPPPPPPPGEAAKMQRNVLAPFQMQAMVQNLLAKRFDLKSSDQLKDMPVYDLVVASSGAKLTPVPKTPPPATFNGEQVIRVRTMIKGERGELELSNGPVGALAGFLSSTLDHQVIDKTGIQGSYNIALHWNPEQSGIGAIEGSLEEQLGLNLVPQHGPVKVLVVNQVEKPTED